MVDEGRLRLGKAFDNLNELERIVFFIREVYFRSSIWMEKS